MKNYLRTTLKRQTTEGGTEQMFFAISDMRGKVTVIRTMTNENGVSMNCIPGEIPTGQLDTHIANAQKEGWAITE